VSSTFYCWPLSHILDIMEILMAHLLLIDSTHNLFAFDDFFKITRLCYLFWQDLWQHLFLLNLKIGERMAYWAWSVSLVFFLCLFVKRKFILFYQKVKKLTLNRLCFSLSFLFQLEIRVFVYLPPKKNLKESLLTTQDKNFFLGGSSDSADIWQFRH